MSFVKVSVVAVLSLAVCSESGWAQRVAPKDVTRLLGSAPVLGSGPGACLAAAQLRAGGSYLARGRTAMVPVSFSRISRNDAGEYQIGEALNIGLGVSWFDGGAEYTHAEGNAEQATLTVEPELIWGVAVNPGVRNDAVGLSGSVTASGFVGLRTVALAVGYDFIAESPTFGIAFKVDPFRFRRGSRARLCIQEAF